MNSYFDASSRFMPKSVAAAGQPQDRDASSAPTPIESVLAKIGIVGGGISALSIYGSTVGADFCADSDTTAVTVTVDATRDTVATVAASNVGSAGVSALMNGADLSGRVNVSRDSSAPGRVVAGIVVTMKAGDRLDVTFSPSPPRLEGVALTSDPRTFVCHELDASLKACAPPTTLRCT